MWKQNKQKTKQKERKKKPKHREPWVFVIEATIVFPTFISTSPRNSILKLNCSSMFLVEPLIWIFIAVKKIETCDFRVWTNVRSTSSQFEQSF